MINGKKVVLVVDDRWEYCNRICEKLQKNDREAFPVYDLQDAWECIENIPGGLASVDLVIQDGQVSPWYAKRDGTGFEPEDGEKISCTLEFIRDLRKEGYKGPILANSSDPDFNQLMLEAGATHTKEVMGIIRLWEAAEKILAG